MRRVAQTGGHFDRIRTGLLALDETTSHLTKLANYAKAILKTASQSGLKSYG